MTTKMVKALRTALPVLEAAAEPEEFYGHYHGGDPRLFTPAEDECTPEEIAAHKAACEAWERGERAARRDLAAVVQEQRAEIARLTAPVDVDAEVEREAEAARDRWVGVDNDMVKPWGECGNQAEWRAALRPIVEDRARLARELRGCEATASDLAEQLVEARAEIARLKAAPGEVWERLRAVATQIRDQERDGDFRVSDDTATLFDDSSAALAAVESPASALEGGRYKALVAEHRGLAVKEVLRTITEAEAERLVDIRAEIDRIETAMTAPAPTPQPISPPFTPRENPTTATAVHASSGSHPRP